MLVPFWFPYILEMVTAIKNLLAYSSWQINSLHAKTGKPILTPLGFLFHSWTLHQQTTIFIDPSNEHSYQVWFQLAQWFQKRRLKCKSLQPKTQTTTTYDDGRTFIFVFYHFYTMQSIAFGTDTVLTPCFILCQTFSSCVFILSSIYQPVLAHFVSVLCQRRSVSSRFFHIAENR